METKTDPVLIGRILAGAVIAVALLSALLWAVAGRQSGFSMFLDRLVIPMGVGFLIFVATEILRVLTKAQEESGSSIREEQPETRLGRSGGILRQTSQPIPSAVPARLSGLEQQIMERVGRGMGVYRSDPLPKSSAYPGSLSGKPLKTCPTGGLSVWTRVTRRGIFRRPRHFISSQENRVEDHAAS